MTDKHRRSRGRRLHQEDSYWCSDCGAFHEGLPFDYAAPAPDLWLITPDEDREDGILSGDLCWIRVDGQDHYFMRGLIPIAVIDSPRTFNWGVWAMISDYDFGRVIEIWDNKARDEEPSFLGWLATQPAVYPDVIGLELSIHSRSGNQRPTFQVADLEHPIAIEQRNGITIARVQEIAEALIHQP